MTNRDEPSLGTSDPAIAAADYRFRRRRVDDARARAGRGRWRTVLVVALFVATFAVILLGVREADRRATASLPTVAREAEAPVLPEAAPRPDPMESRMAPVRTLNTCVSTTGAKLVTDAPCPVGYAVASSRAFVPDRTPPKPAARPSRNSPAPSASRAPAFGAPDPHRESAQARRRCDAAKAYEADYRDRRGLDITYDELSNLSAHVRRECAGA